MAAQVMMRAHQRTNQVLRIRFSVVLQRLICSRRRPLMVAWRRPWGLLIGMIRRSALFEAVSGGLWNDSRVAVKARAHSVAGGKDEARFLKIVVRVAGYGTGWDSDSEPLLLRVLLFQTAVMIHPVIPSIKSKGKSLPAFSFRCLRMTQWSVR
jgi:hypothetical protein